MDEIRGLKKRMILYIYIRIIALFENVDVF